MSELSAEDAIQLDEFFSSDEISLVNMGFSLLENICDSYNEYEAIVGKLGSGIPKGIKKYKHAQYIKSWLIGQKSLFNPKYAKKFTVFSSSFCNLNNLPPNVTPEHYPHLKRLVVDFSQSEVLELLEDFEWQHVELKQQTKELTFLQNSSASLLTLKTDHPVNVEQILRDVRNLRTLVLPHSQPLTESEFAMIENLSSLEHLEIALRQVSSLGSLSNLRRLKIKLIGVHALVIPPLLALEHLDLSHDSTDMPIDLSKCPNILELHLQETKVQHLDSALYDLQRLRRLEWSRTNASLSIEPEAGALGSLTQLTTVSLKYTGKCPLSLQHCPNITSLAMAGNTEVIPNGLYSLRNLESLSLAGGFSSLGEDVERLQNLRRIDVQSTGKKITFTLPPTVGNLKNLTSISLDIRIKSLPDELFQAPKLNKIKLTERSLKTFTDIPKALYQKYFQNTNILDLPVRWKLPEHWRKALEQGQFILDLQNRNRSNSGSPYGNAISMTPDKLTMLAKFSGEFKGIQTINLSGLTDEYSLEELKQFPNLRHLELRNIHSLSPLSALDNVHFSTCKVSFVHNLSFQDIVVALQGVASVSCKMHVVINKEPTDALEIEALRQALKSFATPPKVTLHLQRRTAWNTRRGRTGEVNAGLKWEELFYHFDLVEGRYVSNVTIHPNVSASNEAMREQARHIHQMIAAAELIGKVRFVHQHDPAWFESQTELVFKDAPISEFPPEFKAFTKLTHLTIQNCSVPIIPEFVFGNLDLRYLNISGNRIFEIPPEVSQLKHLQELDLSNNRIVKISEGLSQCVALQKLLLADNNISGVPHDLYLLENLTHLNLRKNKEIGHIFPLAFLPRAQFVDLYGCTTIPAIKGKTREDRTGVDNLKEELLKSFDKLQTKYPEIASLLEKKDNLLAKQQALKEQTLVTLIGLSIQLLDKIKSVFTQQELPTSVLSLFTPKERIEIQQFVQKNALIDQDDSFQFPTVLEEYCRSEHQALLCFIFASIDANSAKQSLLIDVPERYQIPKDFFDNFRQITTLEVRQCSQQTDWSFLKELPSLKQLTISYAQASVGSLLSPLPALDLLDIQTHNFTLESISLQHLKKVNKLRFWYPKEPLQLTALHRLSEVFDAISFEEESIVLSTSK